jgi:hypothetical protein
MSSQSGNLLTKTEDSYCGAILQKKKQKDGRWAANLITKSSAAIRGAKAE